MQFDSNKAWLSAVALVSANRDVLWALAGVFFVLPNFAFSIAFPQPEPTPGMTPEQMMALVNTYYAGVWPWFLATVILQLLGTLTILTLFTDRSRPTVGGAIRLGAAGIGPSLLAQLLAGLLMMFAALLLIGLGTLTGSPAVLVLTTVLALAGIVYLSVRTILVTPVIAVEGVRNPVTALTRSWQLTRANAGRLVLFFVLLGVAIGVAIGLAMLVLGLVLAVLFSGETARFVATLISSFLVGGMVVYLIAVLAATHRQLAGSSSEVAAQPFE